MNKTFNDVSCSYLAPLFTIFFFFLSAGEKECRKAEIGKGQKKWKLNADGFF